MSVAARFGAGSDDEQFFSDDETQPQSDTVKAGVKVMKYHDNYIPKLKTRIEELEAEIAALKGGKTKGEEELREELAKTKREVAELTEKNKKLPQLEAELAALKEELTTSEEKVKGLETEKQELVKENVRLNKLSKELDALRNKLIEYGELEVAKLVLDFQQKNAVDDSDKLMLQKEAGLVGKKLAKLAKESGIMAE